MLRATGTLLLLLALQACGVETATFGTVAGRVTLGPIMPVCQVGVPCDGVYKDAKVAVRVPGGSAVARTTSDDEGEFTVNVPPGGYEVAIEVDGMLPRCPVVSAVVTARQTVRVQIDCDSGIR